MDKNKINNDLCQLMKRQNRLLLVITIVLILGVSIFIAFVAGVAKAGEGMLRKDLGYDNFSNVYTNLFEKAKKIEHRAATLLKRAQTNEKLKTITNKNEIKNDL